MGVKFPLKKHYVIHSSQNVPIDILKYDLHLPTEIELLLNKIN